MEIMAMKCPNCSGDINYTPGQRVIKCPYCDSMLNITDAAETALENTQKEFKNIEHIRLDYAKRVQSWKGRTYLYYGLVFLLTIIAFLLLDRFRNHSGGYNLGGIIFILLLISFPTVPFIFSRMVPVAPKEIEEQLKVKTGFPTIVKIAGFAVLLALAGAFIVSFISNILGPSAARL